MGELPHPGPSPAEPTDAGTSEVDAQQTLEATAAYYPQGAEVASGQLPPDRYWVLGEIARGGMGVVLRAHDTSFDRTLALKVLLAPRSSVDEERRFLEEAAITAQLQHPGIPPIHGLGRLADKRLFFSMKLIEGRTLTELLRERPTPQTDLPRFLKIFEQIAQTLAYAHSKGIIHRDLKPLNVMVGAFGEVQVMDWGLAKRLRRTEPIADPSEGAANIPVIPSPEPQASIGDLGPEGFYTQAGQVLGTYAFMAPEQARGEVQAIDERCDVFGLGAILCTVLTGRPPYIGADGPTLLKQAQAADLAGAWADLDVCGADAEMVGLAKACLAPQKADRPREGGQVALAVTGHLASVEERLQRARVASAEAEVRTREEQKRFKLAVGLAGAVVLLIVAVGASGLWYVRDQGKREADNAARRSYLEREVAAALVEADRRQRLLHGRLRDEGQAAQLLSDLDEWRELVESARAAWKRADSLAGGGRDILSAELRGRLTTLDGQLQIDEQDRKVAYALDKIRLESSSIVEDQVELWRASPKFAQVFRDAGYDLARDAPAQFGERIRRATIRVALVAGLDFWALVTSDQDLCGRLLEAARAADPETWRDRFRQLDVWNHPGKLKALAAQVDCANQSAQLLAALGQRLRLRQGDAPELLRRAIVFHPRDFWLFLELGLGSTNPVEKAGAFRAALSIRPESVLAYYQLGVVQHGERKLEEALACYQRAIKLDPSYGSAHNNLGLVLDDLNRPDEAIASYRTAIAASPRNVVALCNLGAALQAQQKLDEAITWYRKAIQINPAYTPAYNNLGAALRTTNKLDLAVACFRTAIAMQPDHAMAWCNLGHALRQQGKFGEGLTALQRGQELGSHEPGWSYPSAQWVKAAEYSVSVEHGKVTAVLHGGPAPADAREQLALAEQCFAREKRYAMAVRFYKSAFAAAPNLADYLHLAHRYDAARAAALAAAGKGDDASSLTEAQRVGFRKQALAWLQAELAAWNRLLEKRPLPASTVAQTLQVWQTEADLASVREKSALAKLPPDEQKAWQQFWSDLATLRQKAETASP